MKIHRSVRGLGFAPPCYRSTMWGTRALTTPSTSGRTAGPDPTVHFPRSDFRAPIPAFNFFALSFPRPILPSPCLPTRNPFIEPEVFTPLWNSNVLSFDSLKSNNSQFTGKSINYLTVILNLCGQKCPGPFSRCKPRDGVWAS